MRKVPGIDAAACIADDDLRIERVLERGHEECPLPHVFRTVLHDVRERFRGPRRIAGDRA